MDLRPLDLCDAYKTGHYKQYPKDCTRVYSNMTARKSRVVGSDKLVFFGMQYFIQRYLIKLWDYEFFKQPREKVVKAYKRRIDNYLGPGSISYDHIEALHKLGYLPIKIKALPEGSLVPMGVPLFTITNTHNDFFWVTNMLETLMSNVLWGMSTSATTAFRYRKVFEEYAKITGADPAFIPWQGHDFSFRGIMGGPESAACSGAAHLLSFTGTDTIPAIDLLEEFYGADCEHELIGGSVAATEHSVMSMGMKDGELETFRRLITEVYPKGIVSIVSDTWDFWKVLTEYLPRLKDIILARDGKVVIRPDSGDPVKIICGDPTSTVAAVRWGAVETLWFLFGGKVNKKGFKELDPHIGLIYGDSITPERQVQILELLKQKHFASSNIVLGIGSYTYQMVSRDTYGLAMKATYGETKSGGPQNISKDPATDDGTKKSACGLLMVTQVGNGPYALTEQVTKEQEALGCLETVFEDGWDMNFQSLSEIRKRVTENLGV